MSQETQASGLILSDWRAAQLKPVASVRKLKQKITMQIHAQDTAVVFIDPQNDVLSEKGLSWPLVRESLQENNTIENMELIFKAAKGFDFEVFISPHYFYPTDKGRI